MAKKIPIGLEYKDIEDSEQDVIEQLPILEPYVYSKIIYNNKTYEYFYEVIEPKLTPKEQEILVLLKEYLQKIFEYSPEQNISKEEILRKNIMELILANDWKLTEESKEKLSYYIIRDFIGYERINPLIIDDFIEDISCDGPNIPIFVYHKVYETVKTNIIFPTDDCLDSFVIMLAQRCGKQISIAEPILDGTLSDGSRVQVTLAKEVTTRGSSFTIRRFKTNPLTQPDLVRFGTLSPEICAYFWLAVENGDSIIVCGGTACGKTSTINAISLFIPPEMKIVSMEDTREINIPHKNWIAGITRSGGGGAKEITMFELVRAALRQRPQYIIVGEVRGKEAFILFQAMATGHTTYSTMHADSVESIIHRLENPPIDLPRVLLTALNIIVIQSQVSVKNRFVRRITKIVELLDIDPETNNIITNTVYDWDPKQDKHIYLGHSALFEKIMFKKNYSEIAMNEEFQRRVDVIRWMIEKNIRSYTDVSRIIASYYKDTKSTIEMVRKDLTVGDKNA